MFRRRPALLVRPALDDDALHTTLTELRPSPQLHGLGAGRTRPLWQPAAELLRDTGRDWDRRWHRMSVLAGELPPAVCERWTAERPGDGDALVLRACVRSARAAAEGRAAAREAEQACLRAADACPEDPTPWLALLDVMYALAVPVRDAVPVWTEAVNRAPWHRGAYHRLLRHLSPRGPGTVTAMTDFARHAAARAPHGSPLALLPVAARVELVAHRHLRVRTGLGADAPLERGPGRRGDRDGSGPLVPHRRHAACRGRRRPQPPRFRPGPHPPPGRGRTRLPAYRPPYDDAPLGAAAGAGAHVSLLARPAGGVRRRDGRRPSQTAAGSASAAVSFSAASRRSRSSRRTRTIQPIGTPAANSHHW